MKIMQPQPFRWSSIGLGISLFLICAVSLSFLLHGTFTDSGTMDELAHIPAGYGYVSHLDYRLNPEHPPLVKALAAFPLLFLKLNFPTGDPAWMSDINGQWTMGAKFLYESGNDANLIIRWSRLGPIILTILLILLIYVWAKELVGKWWALLPTFLFALSPSVLAHGHYVTTDIAAALGVFLGTYYFVKFLTKPTKHSRFAAGLAFGVALIAKFSTVLLVPYFLLLLLVSYALGVIRDFPHTETGVRSKRFIKRGLSQFGSLLAVFLVGVIIVVYPTYFLFTLNYPAEKQAQDTESILASFADGPPKPGEFCKPLRCLGELDIWMAKNPVTRPFAEYLLGVLMVIQRSSGGNTGYFWGEVSAAGSPWYFPAVYLLKEPLPVILAVLIAIAVTLFKVVWRTFERKRRIKDRILDYLTLNFAEFAMLLFVIAYWVYSVKSPLNIGFRHLFPILPFTYILIAVFWKNWVMALKVPAAESRFRLFIGWLRTLAEASLKYLVLVVLLLWFFLETLGVFPHFLSYFNQLGGGTWNGYRFVTDSNYDWGQDLLRLEKWVKSHREVDRIAVDYFGAGNPKYYLGGRGEGWSSSRGNPSTLRDASGQTSSGQVPPIHWLAVSVNTLQGAIQRTAPGFERKPEDEYRWLKAARPTATGLGNVPEPDFRAGTSIFIYKL